MLASFVEADDNEDTPIIITIPVMISVSAEDAPGYGAVTTFNFSPMVDITQTKAQATLILGHNLSYLPQHIAE